MTDLRKAVEVLTEALHIAEAQHLPMPPPKR